jgi:serpin B
MTNRSFLTAAAPFLLVLAACGGSSSPGGSPTSPGNPQGVAEAKSNTPREPASSVPASEVSGAVAANNAFAVGLYSQVLTGPGASTGNVLTSPLSASLALTMTYAGAKGTTATQMASALQFGSAAGSIFDGQNALSQALASRAAQAFQVAQQQAQEGGNQPAPSADDYNLQVVNSVWGEQTYTWEQPFLDIMAQDYGTGVFLEDFVNSYDQARQSINTWVSTETLDKINNLLPEGSLDSMTRMVLVDAIHLKLPWQNAFQVSQTQNAAFTRSDGSTVQVPLMNEQLTASYVDDGKAQIVSLPLTGGQIAVQIALPHGDLASYEAGLTAGSNAITTPTGQALVTLSLPKVSFTTPTFSLAKDLKAMGMTQAFDPTAADFTGLCANPPDHLNLYISDVLQKAMVAMQETGVEAAAATAVIVSGASAVTTPPPSVTMTVNKPYLVSIVDVPTGAVLFLGHIEDPSDTGSQ